MEIAVTISIWCWERLGDVVNGSGRRRGASSQDQQVVSYDIPRKSIAGYYPECNGLISLWHFAEGSKVPAANSIPLRISPTDCRQAAE